MEKIIEKIKSWWNHPCFWSHDYEIVATENRACAYQCKTCSKIKLYIR